MKHPRSKKSKSTVILEYPGATRSQKLKFAERGLAHFKKQNRQDAETKPVIDYFFRIEEDETPVRGNALASGDDKTDREAEDEIRRKVMSGNIAAWCVVIVTARCTWNDTTFHGESILGACSYDSEEAARADLFDYACDMKDEALEHLKSQVKESIAAGKDAADLWKRAEWD